jgi:hypothetical protein
MGVSGGTYWGEDNIKVFLKLDVKTWNEFTWIRKGRADKDSSVDIATRYGLDGPGIESR